MSHLLSFCKVHLMLLVLSVISPLSLHAQYDMIIHYKDGTTTSFSVSSIDSVTFKETPMPTTYTINDVEYPMAEAVDLGLPSGTIWANMNIGANKEDEEGLQFAWGNLTGYTYDELESIYDTLTTFHTFDKFYTTHGYSKYNNNDNLTTLELEDDAAAQYLDHGWIMPTKDDFEELVSNCSISKDSDGKYRLTSKNGNYIVLSGQSWSSSLESDGYAYILEFTQQSIYDIYGMDRIATLSIRPIRRQK